MFSRTTGWHLVFEFGIPIHSVVNETMSDLHSFLNLFCPFLSKMRVDSWFGKLKPLGCCLFSFSLRVHKLTALVCECSKQPGLIGVVQVGAWSPKHHGGTCCHWKPLSTKKEVLVCKLRLVSEVRVHVRAPLVWSFHCPIEPQQLFRAREGIVEQLGDSPRRGRPQI